VIEALWLSLRLAALTTALLILLTTPLAWWLARSRRWWKEVVGAMAGLPIVLPPTVLGFYLLLALGPSDPLIQPLAMLHIRTLAFSFAGLVIGSCIYSLPFAVQPIRNAFAAIGDSAFESAKTLGAGNLSTFARVALPLARPGFLTAVILVFVHTMGEFGVVLMIGGDIPGKTEVLSIKLFQLVDQQEWGQAHVLAAGLVAMAFAVTLAVLLIERRSSRLRG
jgi:molybdate transport system permease protein